MARFSSRVVRRISVTWSFEVLQTRVTTGVAASRRRATWGSFSTAVLARRVLPKAASFACLNLSFLASRKKSMSFSLEPGQPP